ncbi:hypothetical protein SARC_03019 [Sphaeroforma arctica JP610]|uniref:Uncharacterized protein n=1 Tax=Sphaeroforma arctica JP610 TaxID=667725 RepID=A0A0L0G6X3_9EUKA|nr:hypothetical protein SARC_03019 [Sphaeroforma arctica JP610]KNC84777.1 hypothetical protein SARC_03019 [Sphaeroforma arctica JP610]|eukprot:XP_014158679.1 hypothetical protein SARC_03019 [Sphaeroforma arctica JP610]
MNTDSYTGARASSDTRAQKANISNYSMHDRVGGSTRMDPSVRLLSKTLSLARAQTSGVYAPVCMRENSMSIAPRPHSVTHAHDRDGGLGDVADTSTYKFAPVQKAHTSGLPYSHTHTSSSLGVSGGYSRSQQTPNNRPTPGLSGNRESSREYRGSERGSASVRDTSSIHRDSTHARQYSLTYAQPDTRTRANRNTDTHTYPDTHTRTNTNTSRHRHADTHASTQGMPSSHTRLSNHYEGSTRLSGLVGHADPGEDMDEDRFEEESTQSKGSPGRSIGR